MVKKETFGDIRSYYNRFNTGKGEILPYIAAFPGNTFSINPVQASCSYGVHLVLENISP